jgi:nucleoside-diphosphate-sugar epimerase
LNVIRQAEKAGIKKIVVTSSVAAISNPSGKFSDTGMLLWSFFTLIEPLNHWIEWNPITREHALKDGSAFIVYTASKTLAERAVWEFADAHPRMNITVREYF